jgi:hypothetical protein
VTGFRIYAECASGKREWIRAYVVGTLDRAVELRDMLCKRAFVQALFIVTVADEWRRAEKKKRKRKRRAQKKKGKRK